MCDPTAIVSGVMSGATAGTGGVGPFTPSQQFGSFLGGSGGKIAGGLFDIARDSSAAGSQQEAIGKRTAQIEFESGLQKEQIKDIAERRLGGQRGRIAKAGLKTSGTTKRLLEEQIKQDELDLLKQSISTQSSLGEQRKASKRVEAESGGRLAQTVGSLFGLDK